MFMARKRCAGHAFASVQACRRKNAVEKIADHSRLFGDADEDVWGDLPPVRVLPARKNLKADHILLRQRNDRLIVRHDLAACDRSAQVVLHLRARLDGEVHLRLEKPNFAAALAFALIHRDVRRMHQAVDVGFARLRNRDANCAIHFDLAVVPGNGLLRRLLDPLGQPHKEPLFSVKGREERELVAAKAGHRAALRREGA
jgi:hypothetical protein